MHRRGEQSRDRRAASPSVSSSGIDSTRSLRNPITCERMERPEEVRTSHEIADRNHRSARRNEQPNHLGHFADPGQHFHAWNLRDQFSDGCTRRRHCYSAPTCRSARARSRATAFPPTHPGCLALSQRKPRAGLRFGSRRQNQVLRRAGLFQQLANQWFQCRMHAHAVNLARLQLRKRRLDQPSQGVRIHGHFAMNHARGNRDRQMHQVLNGFLSNALPQPGQRVRAFRASPCAAGRNCSSACWRPAARPSA